MKKRLLTLALVASLITAALPAVALAQEELPPDLLPKEPPEDLEDQPIVCTEGVDCPGDPGYIPLPGEPPADPEPPSDINLEQPEVAPPPEGELPPGAGVFPPGSPRSEPPEGKASDSSGSQVKPGGQSGGSSSGSSSSGGSQSKGKAKELPRTGGTVSTSLLALGAGTLLVGGGLLVRKKFAR